MHHPEILNQFGLTSERLLKIFTCKDDTCADGQINKRIRERIKSRMDEGVRVCAENSKIFQAVDIAWDSQPIQKETLPLLLWAQGKITREQIQARVESNELSEELITKKPDGKIEVNMPRLYEMSISLVRSYVTRRLAAQSARFANLWPNFRYEPRGVDEVSKLKAETLSQRIDIMSDAYNYRHFGTQLIRDQLLYARSLAFPRGAWDKKTQWRKKRLNVESKGGKLEVESYVLREGVDFVNPHPSRCYWDLSAPLANINTDTGPCYIGYWDIIRFGTLTDTEGYYNTDVINSGEPWAQLIQKYQDFLHYYFDPKILSWPGPKDDPSLGNSRAANTGVYTSEDRDRGCLVVQHYERINPKQEDICDYDCDIWMRFSVAGDGTIIGCEPMPSIPAAYGGINENDSRVVNTSMAMELLAYQDQLSNLASHMLMNIRSSMVQLWLLDKDSLEKETLEYFENGAKQRDFFTEPKLLMYSSSKLRDLGVDDPSKAFRIIQTDVKNTIDVCFNGITRLLNLADRLMILSPNELGQPAPREITKAEVQEIANTTSSISTFISDGTDEQRAAQKRMLYDALICHSTKPFRVPAMRRYSIETLRKAGFDVSDTVNLEDGKVLPIKTPIVGSVDELIFDYVFDSRDGAERTPNSEVAKTITNLIQFLTSNETVAKAMGKRRLFELVNEAVRLSGAGVDFQLSLDEGESESMGDADMAKVIEELQALVKELQARVAQLEQVAQVTAPPADQQGGLPGGLPPELLEAVLAGGGAPAELPAPPTLPGPPPAPAEGPDGGTLLALGNE